MKISVSTLAFTLWTSSLLCGQSIWFGSDASPAHSLNALNQSQAMQIADLPERVELLCRSADGGAWLHLENETTLRKYGPTGDLLHEIPTQVGLAAMALDSNGNLWATRPGMDDVIQVAVASAEVTSFPVAGVPYGIAVDGTGRIWVSCSYSNEVMMLDPSGAITASIPVGFFPTGLSATHDGGVWLAEKQGLRRLGSDGQTLWTGSAGVFPIGVTTDVSGRAWFTCQSSHQIVVVSDSGIDAVIDVEERPLGVAAHMDGSVTVLCRLGSKVQRFAATGALLSEVSAGFPAGRGDMTGLQISLVVDPLGDFDGDGVTNSAEINLGSNPFLEPQPSFLRGDVDRNGILQLADVVAALAILYSAQHGSCMEALDVNDDDQLDLADPIRILNYLYLGSIPPENPFPTAGQDPAPIPGYSCSN